MSPTEWQVWNFGVILSFALLGLTVAIVNIPGIVLSIIILFILWKNYKDPKPNEIRTTT